MEPRTILEDLFYLLPLMNAPAVPQQDEGAAEVTEHVPEKNRHLAATDIVLIEVHIEPQAMSWRAHRKGRDSRYLVAPVTMMDHRRFPTGSPGAPDIGEQQKPAFIEEDQVRLPALGFF